MRTEDHMSGSIRTQGEAPLVSLARARTFLRPPDLLAPFAFAGAAELVVLVERLGVARDALLLMPLEGPPRHDLQHTTGRSLSINFADIL